MTSAEDLDLLRRYEPEVRYTRGELFFPCAVEDYIVRCSLWARSTNGRARLLVSQGSLDLDRLASFGRLAGRQQLYLRFVDEPLRGIDYQRWRLRPEHTAFEARGRLSRVPLGSRLLDSLFDLSLLLRGTVPGGTTAAAEIEYRQMQRLDSRRVYYGRVVREGGWTILHYLFFYAMNNWRSTFYGINDHEADWEQVFIFLNPTAGGSLQPRWVAYASHDFQGDDLRRRWDDPTIVKNGDHPVIFAGAGSHASYFEQGEYLMGATPAFLAPLDKLLQRLRKLWNESLGMGSSTESPESDAPPDDISLPAVSLSVPYVDYARGDGPRIGPGQSEEWTPVLISTGQPWVSDYRGLWGLDTRDPLGGERAPSGPRYNRDGTVRMSWYDPLGWAGLDKVHPPSETSAAIEQRIASLSTELADLQTQIDAQRQVVRALELDHRALSAGETTGARLARSETGLLEAQAALQAQRLRQSELGETIQALQNYLNRIQSGDWGNPAGHLRHVHHPEPPLPNQRWLVELWAAVSGALALLSVVALLVLRPSYWQIWILSVLVLLGAVEAAARQRLVNYILNLVITLAVITTLVLAWEFWELVILLALALVAFFILRDNLTELRRRGS